MLKKLYLHNNFHNPYIRISFETILRRDRFDTICKYTDGLRLKHKNWETKWHTTNSRSPFHPSLQPTQLQQNSFHCLQLICKSSGWHQEDQSSSTSYFWSFYCADLAACVDTHQVYRENHSVYFLLGSDISFLILLCKATGVTQPGTRDANRILK